MSAMLIFLTIVCILIVIFIFIGNVYILAYFSHPEDQITDGIWYYRGLVILSLSFACYIIFAIPLDISSANRADSIGLGYPMDFIWALINFVICAAVMFLLPFALSVYTNHETEFKRKLKYALKTAGVVLGFHLVLCIVYKIMCGKAQITINVASIYTQWAQVSSAQQALIGSPLRQATLDYAFIEVPLSFLMSCTLHIVVMGSFLFVFIGGYGLAYLPIEFLNDFLNRPQIRDAEDLTLTKIILKAENDALIDRCKAIETKKQDLEQTIGWLAQRKKRLELQRDINKIKADFMEFQEVMESFRQEMNMQEVNPLVYLAYLIAGTVCFVGSFLIIFHTLFINVNKQGKPVSYLLNNMYIFFSDKLAPLFAIASWLIMNFYLLLCLIRGNMILNGPLTNFIGIQQLKIGQTWMSAFLVNCMLMLLSSMGMLAYLAANFESWMRNTAAERMFKLLIANARWVRYFYKFKIFSFGIILIFLGSVCYLLSQPSKKSKINQIMKQKKKERMEANKKQD